MISSLHIENIAVVKTLDVDMRAGFTVLSGETGAGKSIIIDCLNLLSGVRADKGIVRTGERSGEVCAVFCNISDRAKSIIEELGFSVEDRSIMLSRSISADSASSARVNGRAVTLSVLREISSVLFNIHGQNDSHRLLDRANHIELLDTYAGCADDVSAYSEIYAEIVRYRRELDAFNKDIMETNRLREMLKYQIDDIDAVKLKEGEEEALVAESQRLQSIEKIKKQSMLVQKALNGGEKGVGAAYLIDRAASALEQLSAIIPEAEGLASRLTEVKYEIDDISEAALSLGEFSDEDPTARIDKIETRLEAISKLKRKYGSTVGEILHFRDEAAERLDAIENSDERISQLQDKLSSLCGVARQKALEIRKKRVVAARSLTAKVTETLEFLDMPKVRFEVSLVSKEELCPNGLDEVEFLIATNAGEPMMPMIKIASGGELARIMLSLKSALNECDGIDTAIFDEIDTGISGKTSRKVGIKLREIAKGSQVVCVTHSAQIASLADSHLFVSKSEKDGRVQTALSELGYDERVEEIARILGGIEISEIQRSAAREMIDEGREV